MRCFSLKLVEMNGLSVGGFFFGMVICGPSVVFSACFFGGYDGCQSADRGCGWFGGVGVVEAFCSVGIIINKINKHVHTTGSEWRLFLKPITW